jgi:predicted RNA-binding protein with PIN domain
MEDARSPSERPSDDAAAVLAGLDDDLTVALADAAAEVLRALPADAVPASLRPLLGFDRRRLASQTARRQLLRALERDSSFRSAVEQALRLDDTVAAVVDGLGRGTALGRVIDAAERGDLALMVAALWATRPDGWEYALGCVAGIARGDAARRAAVDDADALARRIETEEAARHRADAQRAAAEARAAELVAELREARRERRTRDESAAAREQAAVRRADAAEAALARERARAVELEQVVQRETARADRLATNRDETPTATAVGESSMQVEEIASIARQAAHLAERLRAVERATRRAEDASRSGTPARAPRPPRPPAPQRRAAPPLASGLGADTAAGVRSMLRNGTLLVVDGYNVSHRGWPDATIAEQRERLARALHQLHHRQGSPVVCCFDGEGQPPATLRRDGLRVLFSEIGEEADELVVRVVEDQPKRTPVVVASSDAWVREHAEAAGAVVVSAATLLDALHAADRRP